MALKNDWRLNETVMPEHMNDIADEVNNHLAIPHITYREVTPITTIDVLASDNNEAILTDKQKLIMAKKVQLLTADGKQEVLHPETAADMVKVNNTTLDKELLRYLPLTGGTLTGPLIIADNAVFPSTPNILGTTLFNQTLNGLSITKNDNDLNGFPLNFTTTLTIKYNDNRQFQLNGDMTGNRLHWRAGHEQSINVNGTGFSTWKELWHSENFKIESGSWTPILTGANGGSIVNYTVQTGNWYRRGNVVTCNCRIVGSGIQGFNGELRITGLPFANAGMHTPVTIATARGLNGLAPNRQFGAYIRDNASHVMFGCFDTYNQDSFDIMDQRYLNNAGHIDLLLQFTYEVAQ